jgi:hypothetical protein
MGLTYKPDFEDAKRYWRAYWAGEIIDRPCVCLKTRREDAKPVAWPPGLNGFHDPDDVLPRVDEGLSQLLWLAEAVPFFQPNFGPDQYAAWLGVDLCHSSVEEGTSWSVPIIEDWTADGRNIDRPHGVWWECALELYRKAAGYSEGKFLVGVPDIHSNMDALSALRGPERLCVDLLDQPERIDRAMALVRRAFAPVF